MAARLFDAAFALVYLRLLGPPQVGNYAFVVVFTTYLDTLVDFGLNALMARDIPRAPETARTARRAVNLLRLGLWLVGLPLVAIVYGPARDIVNLTPEAALAGWVFYVALLPSVLAKTATGLLWAFERLEVPAAVSVVATMLKAAFGAVLLFAGYGLLGLAMASLLVNLVTATSLVLAARAVTPVPVHDAPGAPPRTWLRESWPLFVNQMLQGLFFKIDSLLLPGLASATAAGIYAAAYKVSEGAGIVSSSVTLAIFPRLARTNDLRGAYRLALRTLLQVAFPLAAGVALLAVPLVALVGGRAYLPDSATALAILICYLPLSYANGLMQYVLIAVGQQRRLTAAFLGAAVFNIVANFLVIPRFGYVGAAWITVISEVVLLVPFSLAVRRAAPGVSLLAEARHALLATALMAPVVWWLRDAAGPLLAIAAGVVVYPLALWSLGGIDAQQSVILRQLLPARLHALTTRL